MSIVTNIAAEIKLIPKNVRLFLKNVWLLLSFDPFDKPFFSFLCGIFP